MNLVIAIAALVYFLVGIPTFAHNDCHYDDAHLAFGRALLWPLFVLKFVIVSAVRAAKELAV